MIFLGMTSSYGMNRVLSKMTFLRFASKHSLIQHKGEQQIIISILVVVTLMNYLVLCWVQRRVGWAIKMMAR